LSRLLAKLFSKSANNKGLLRRSGDMQFLNKSDIMRIFLNLFYKHDVVAILYDCDVHCDNIPKLQILKRDNWGAYWWAKHNEIVIIKFESVPKAEDWVFSISRNTLAKWEIYDKTILVRNDMGKVKPQTWDKVETEDNG
jgi:hypothetical protein